MSDDHKPLGELPEDWICMGCQHPAWQYASIHPRSEMNCDDRATVEEYGTDTTQFADAEHIELCGYCGGSRWQKLQRTPGTSEIDRADRMEPHA